jgi:hypothetical protein
MPGAWIPDLRFQIVLDRVDLFLPAFVRPSRSENVSLLLNAPMRGFLRRAFDGRR